MIPAATAASSSASRSLQTCMDNAAELLDAFAEPGEFFLADPVVLRVARLHIGRLQLLEQRALTCASRGQTCDQARRDLARPGSAGSSRLCDVRACRSVQDQQHAVVKPFRCLMELESGACSVIRSSARAKLCDR